MPPGDPHILTEHQRLATSGARAVELFEIDGVLRLAIPQLAEDIAGEPAHMNGGNSDVEALLFRWHDDAFISEGTLALPGGEDLEYFRLAGDHYLAAASLRTGSGPYELNGTSMVYRWDAGRWAPFQAFTTFAAKQWSFFQFDDRAFLALAQGVTVPGLDARHPRTSRIFEWTGNAFQEFQVFDGSWGYNWRFFEIDGAKFLAYADHTSDSLLLRWDGARFVPYQTLAPHGGRAFAAFEVDGRPRLAFAAIDAETTLYDWNGSTFVPQQILGGPGGREFEVIVTARGLHLVRVCFIEGTPTSPKTDLQSQIYRWSDGAFEKILDFPTFGATDAAAFHVGATQYLAVSNSLSADVRYAQETVVYTCLL